MSRYNQSRASRSAYMHTTSAPELDFGQTPDVEVYSGTSSQAEPGLPKAVFSLACVVVAVCFALTLMALARLSLSASSVSTTIATSELSSQIESARAAGSDLEVQQSQLSNSMHVRLAAEGLGLGAAESTVAIDLGEDVVATDASGNLSLSGSIENMGAQG